jgi:hypothetical protein
LGNVGKCRESREMSGNVGKCREMSGNVGKSERIFPYLSGFFGIQLDFSVF